MSGSGEFDRIARHFAPLAAPEALGLLDDALALDMRKPQDYFHRIWSTAFRATDLAARGGSEGIGEDMEEEACA